MNWQELRRHFDQTFDFFDRINVGDSPVQQGVSVHPLIKLSAGLALKTIANPKTNRLVILLPNRLQFARWIATLSVLEVMRKDYRENPAGKMRFPRGQKLLVHNRVVRFVRKEYLPEQKKWRLWVECGDGTWAIPLDKLLDFQPVNTKRRLSKLESVRQAYYSSPSVEAQIDTILGVHSHGNRSLFTRNLILVSKIGETTHFIQEHYLNTSKIIDLFQWGKLDVDGNVTMLTSGQLAASPSCLIASDLYSIAEYTAGNPQQTEGIIVDGLSSCLRDTQRLDDDLLSRNIPTIVIADLFDTESLSHLEERGFKVWQWNRHNLSHSRSIAKVSRESPFSSLNRSITNYARQQIIRELCEYQQLNEIAESTWSLGRTVAPSEDDQLKKLYSQLIRLVNELSRLVWLPAPVWMANFCQRVQCLQEDFASQKLWWRKDTAQTIESILKNLMDLGQNPCPGINHKAARFRHFIDNLSPSDVIAIAVPTARDAAAAKQYWHSEIPSHCFNQLHFVAISDLQGATENLLLTQIVICGWLYHQKMYPLLHLHLAPKITLLLYPFEIRWFRSAQRRWKKQNNYYIRGRDFSGILKLPKNKLDFVDYAPQETDSLSEDANFDIIDFELKVRHYRYSRFAATDGARDEAVKAKTVVFTQNKFAFITENHRLLVITDVVRGKSSGGKILRRDISRLQIGDYILFREVDSDIIREIADSALAEQNLSHLRQIAGLWHEALQVKYQELGRDLDELTLLLWEVGCKRQQPTIKNWLFDEDQIGPRDKKDLERIAEVTGNAQLREELEEVAHSIQIVRGAHLQAANYVTQKLLANLPEILDNELEADGIQGRFATLDLDDFGQVMILRVEEISNEWKEYEPKWVNRLLTQEDD